jgi:hypothetical protein
LNELFRAVSARLKAIFTAHAALELEAELLLGHVERKVALLQRAAQLDKEGMTELAKELRQHAGAMDLGTPNQNVSALAGPLPNGNEPESTPSTGRKKKS